MIVNKCSENLLTKSKKLYENYRDNCTVVQRMLEKYKKIYPNISDYSINCSAVYQKELALLLIQASLHPLLIAFRNRTG